MKISILIGSHNEGDYLDSLLNSLQNWLNSPETSKDSYDYEVVVVDDFSEDDATKTTLEWAKEQDKFFVYYHALNNDFAAHKNFMNANCSGDWILNLDADEFIPESFLSIMPLLIEANPYVEVFWMPRVNTVDGLTLKHVQQWKWVISKMDEFVKCRHRNDISNDHMQLLKEYDFILKEDDGWITYHEPIVCWPDMQMRLYKNSKKIKWSGKVHERLTGYEHFTLLPLDLDYAIRHFKEISRQEKQNSYYETL